MDVLAALFSRVDQLHFLWPLVNQGVKKSLSPFADNVTMVIRPDYPEMLFVERLLRDSSGSVLIMVRARLCSFGVARVSAPP